MNKIENELKIEQFSIYYDVITKTLKQHKSLNITQILIFSYLKKKESTLGLKLYNKNNRNDILFKVFSTALGDYTIFLNNSSFILEIIHLLISSDRMIKGTDGNFSLSISSIKKIDSGDETIVDLAIKESQSYSESQLWREFLSYV